MSEIEDRTTTFCRLPQLRQFIDYMPDVVLLLNENGQTVLANRTAASFLELDDPAAIYGMRPGEILDCLHAAGSDAGCGMTLFCGTCGASKAIHSGMRGQEDTQEYRLTRSRDKTAVDFRVWSSQIMLEGRRFVLCVLRDVGDEKRRGNLELLFFHDIMNTAGNLQGCAEILKVAAPDEIDEFKETMYDLSIRLIDEIDSQREFLAAEDGYLVVHPVALQSIPLLQEVAGSNRRHEVGQGREIIIDPSSQQIEFTSDGTLLRRVLNNMTKNALEASEPGETVTLSCGRTGDTIRFCVHNAGFIPREIQLQIFHRSFSTKSPARGLGTYSMRLLTERYLNGVVSFASSQEHGTTFTASYPLDPDREEDGFQA